MKHRPPTSFLHWVEVLFDYLLFLTDNSLLTFYYRAFQYITCALLVITFHLYDEFTQQFTVFIRSPENKWKMRSRADQAFPVQQGYGF